jgi:hypothetical protein
MFGELPKWHNSFNSQIYKKLHLWNSKWAWQVVLGQISTRYDQMVTIHNSRIRSFGILDTLISQVGVLTYGVSLVLAMENGHTMELV